MNWRLSRVNSAYPVSWMLDEFFLLPANVCIWKFSSFCSTEHKACYTLGIENFLKLYYLLNKVAGILLILPTSIMHYSTVPKTVNKNLFGCFGITCSSIMYISLYLHLTLRIEYVYILILISYWNYEFLKVFICIYVSYTRK